jgi:hypothetical protein
LVGNQAAEKVGRAPGRIRHDHLDGFAGIGRFGKAGHAYQDGQALAGNRPPTRQPAGLSQGKLFLLADAFANHISVWRDRSKATKVQPGDCGAATAAIAT